MLFSIKFFFHPISTGTELKSDYETSHVEVKFTINYAIAAHS